MPAFTARHEVGTRSAAARAAGGGNGIALELGEAAQVAGGLQVVFAGKSHPKDHQGQAILRQLHEEARRSGGLLRVALIPDYSMWHGRLLTGGVEEV